jgi:hypothetical protein
MTRTGDHGRVRRAVAKQVAAGGVFCARCGRPIRPGDAFDLDHIDTPYIDGGAGRRVASCQHCNRSHGGKLAQQRRRARKAVIGVNFYSLGVEINFARTNTWLALAGKDRRGQMVVSLQDPLQGTDATARIVSLWEEQKLEQIVIDPQSQSSTLCAPLKAEGMPLLEVSPREVAAMHGIFLDGLQDGRIKHQGHSALGAAVRGAADRPLAGSRAVERRVTGDAAPLVAAELAVWGVPDDEAGLSPDQVTAIWI